MNEREFSKKLLSKLDQMPVEARVAKRLAASRQAALDAAHPEPVLALVGQRWIGFWQRHQTIGLGMILLVVLLTVGGTWQWQHHRAAERVLDAQLLADELPVEAYLSEGFDQWHK